MSGSSEGQGRAILGHLKGLVIRNNVCENVQNLFTNENRYGQYQRVSDIQGLMI